MTYRSVLTRRMSLLTLIFFIVFIVTPFPGYAENWNGIDRTVLAEDFTADDGTILKAGTVKFTSSQDQTINIGTLNQLENESWAFFMGGKNLNFNVDDQVSLAGKINIFNGLLGVFSGQGVHFTETANINLHNAGFIGAAMRLTEQSTGINLKLQGDANGGYLLNEGKITGNGELALLGRAVENRGEIGTVEMPLNRITIAGGDAMTVGLSGDNLISVVVDEVTSANVKNFGETELADQIKNSGNIIGNKIRLDAKGIDGVFEKAINLTGEIQAVDVRINQDGVAEFVSQGELDLEAMGDVDNHSIIKANQMDIDTEGSIRNFGTIDAKVLNEHGYTFISTGTLSGGDVYMDNTDGAGFLSGHISSNVSDAGTITFNGNVFFDGTSDITISAGSTGMSAGWIDMGAYSITGNGHNLTLAMRGGGTNSTIGSISNINNLTLNAPFPFASQFQLTGTIDSAGSLTVGSNVTLNGTGSATIRGGNVSNNGAINMTGGTFLVDGTGNLSGNSATFYNLTIGDGSGTSTTTRFGLGINVSNNMSVAANQTFTGNGGGAVTQTITGDLTNAGTISGSDNFTVNGGDVTGDGTFSMTGGTLSVRGSGNFGGNGSWTLGALTFGDGASTTTTTGVGSGTVTVGTNIAMGSNLTITANHTLNTASNTFSMTGDLSNAGTLSGAANINILGGAFTGDGAVTMTAGTVMVDGAGNFGGNTDWNFYNLKMGNGVLGSFGETITKTTGTAGNITVANDFDVAVHQSFNADNDTYTIGNNFTNAGTFTAGASTVVFNATDTGNVIKDGGSNFYNVTMNGGVNGRWSFFDSTTINNDLVVAAGTLSGTNDITVLGGDITGNGTINLSGGTLSLRGSGNFGGNTNWTFNNAVFGNNVTTATTAKTGSNNITALTRTVNTNHTLTPDTGWTIGAVLAPSTPPPPVVLPPSIDNPLNLNYPGYDGSYPYSPPMPSDYQFSPGPGTNPSKPTQETGSGGMKPWTTPDGKPITIQIDPNILKEMQSRAPNPYREADAAAFREAIKIKDPVKREAALKEHRQKIFERDHPRPTGGGNIGSNIDRDRFRNNPIQFMIEEGSMGPSKFFTMLFSGGSNAEMRPLNAGIHNFNVTPQDLGMSSGIEDFQKAIFSAVPKSMAERKIVGPMTGTSFSKITGPVKVIAKNGAIYDAKQGLTLQVGDQVWTGEGAKVEMETEDGKNVVTIKENSAVRVDSKVSGDKVATEDIMAIAFGMVSVAVSGGATQQGDDAQTSSFVVQTPVGVSGMRA